MTIGQLLLNNYLEGKIDAIEAIRTLSGIFDPDQAVGLLAIICAITRVEQGDLDRETFKSVYIKWDYRMILERTIESLQKPS